MRFPCSDWLKGVLPPTMVGFVQGARYRGLVAHLRLVLQQRRLFRRFARWNRGLPAHEICVRPGFRFALSPEARQAFEHFTHIDPDMVSEMDQFIEQTRGCHCLFDIGALYGIFSLVFASRPNTRAFAFEPSAESQAILRKILQRNPGFHIQAIDTAVGDTVGQIEMFHMGAHLLCAGEEASSSPTVSLPITTIDEFMARNNVIPDVLKIDVEGYEDQVLIGAQRLLSEHSPLIFLEIHPQWLHHHQSSAKQIFERLKKLGYHIHDCEKRPLSVADLSSLEGQVAFRVVAKKTSYVHSF